MAKDTERLAELSVSTTGTRKFAFSAPSSNTD